MQTNGHQLSYATIFEKRAMITSGRVWCTSFNFEMLTSKVRGHGSRHDTNAEVITHWHGLHISMDNTSVRYTR